MKKLILFLTFISSSLYAIDKHYIGNSFSSTALSGAGLGANDEDIVSMTANPASLNLKKNNALVLNFNNQNSFNSDLNNNNQDNTQKSFIPNKYKFAGYLGKKLNSNLDLGLAVYNDLDYKIDGSHDDANIYMPHTQHINLLNIKTALSYQILPDTKIGSALTLVRRDIGIEGSNITQDIYEYKGKDWGINFDLGVMHQVYFLKIPTNLAFNLGVMQNIDQEGEYINYSTNYYDKANYSMSLPITLDFSVKHSFNKYNFYYTIAWQNWSKTKSIDINCLISCKDDIYNIDINDPSNSWRIAIGNSYNYKANIEFFAGFSFEQKHSEVTSEYLNANSFTYSSGISYKLNLNTQLNLAFAFSHIKDSNYNDLSINYNEGTSLIELQHNFN